MGTGADTHLSRRVRLRFDGGWGHSTGVLLAARCTSVSSATLYRLFADVGGVSRYIRERRLQRCLGELVASGADERTVGEAAACWGFDNPSHFNRLFRAEFGCAPSLVKHGEAQIPRRAHDPHAAGKIKQFHSWASES